MIDFSHGISFGTVSAGRRETTNLRDLCAVLPSAAERRVIDMAREYYRTGGQAHNELMDAVQQLERAYLNVSTRPATCFCGTGREHVRGSGYHCGKADGDA